MTPSIALLAGILTALIPLAASVWLIRAQYAGRERELARLALVTALSGLLLLAGPWVWLAYWMRPVVAVVLIAAVFRSALRLTRSASTSTGSRLATLLMAAGASGLVLADLRVIRSGWPTTDITALECPLRGETFVVLQGGNSVVTNPFHRSDPAGRLSLDIVALGGFGNRARKLLPLHVSDYFVFGLPVRSPCTGVVIDATDGLSDNSPGRADVRRPPGNHLLLRCGSDSAVVVLLAHLQMNSVRKRAGDRVLVGEVVGTVGNSGNTSEPHLHIQATRGDLVSGKPVSLLLDGRFLTANSVVCGR